jgi:hypothetical protein
MVYLSACVFRFLVELESTELAAMRFRDTEAIGRIESKIDACLKVLDQ